MIIPLILQTLPGLNIYIKKIHYISTVINKKHILNHTNYKKYLYKSITHLLYNIRQTMMINIQQSPHLMINYSIDTETYYNMHNKINGDIEKINIVNTAQIKIQWNETQCTMTSHDVLIPKIERRKI